MYVSVRKMCKYVYIYLSLYIVLITYYCKFMVPKVDRKYAHTYYANAWRRHQMKTFFASLPFCEGNPPVTGWFPSQRPVTRSFDAFFDLCLIKRLSKQSRRRWFETPSRPWRHCNTGPMFPGASRLSQSQPCSDHKTSLLSTVKLLV